jgi:hypothetical protein
MGITLVKAARPGDRDRAYLTAGDAARRGPIQVIHDLPHLVVESLSGITDGLWPELARVSPGVQPRGHGSRPQAPRAGADRVRGSHRHPCQPVADARAPLGEDDHQLRSQSVR